MKRIKTLLLFLMFLVSIASAIPTTNDATDITVNNVTWSGSGISGGVGWFQWSMNSQSVYAHTPNQSTASGAISYTMVGMPLMPAESYYFRACDASGCGAVKTFTMPVPTPLPTVIDGSFGQNLSENRFNILNLVWNASRPYTAITGDTLFYALICMMIFVGIWLRTRGTQTATTLGMLCVGLFAVSGAGLGLGLPPEFVQVAQAVCYTSIAGAVVAFTFK